MPDVPLVMIHCALLDEIPSSLQQVQTRSTEDDPRCAAFWSISSTQDGLRGIDLGHALIKRAVSELRVDFQSLEHFSTLSPIPGFMPWLRALGDGDSGDGDGDGDGGVDSALDALRNALDDAGVVSAAIAAGDSEGEDGAPASSSALRVGALRLAERYLLDEVRSGSANAGGSASTSTALCPVLNFHCRNGAVVHRLNWGADPSERGLRQSAGIMVNYRYDLDALEQNAIRYVAGGARHRAASAEAPEQTRAPEELSAEERVAKVEARLAQIGRGGRVA
jgi:hypothetical protein